MNSDFDRRFNQASRGIAGAFIFNALITLAVLVFLGWVVVKVMQHFHII